MYTGLGASQVQRTSFGDSIRLAMSWKGPRSSRLLFSKLVVDGSLELRISVTSLLLLILPIRWRSRRT